MSEENSIAGKLSVEITAVKGLDRNLLKGGNGGEMFASGNESVVARIRVGRKSERTSDTTMSKIFARGPSEIAVAWDEFLYLNLRLSDIETSASRSPLLRIELICVPSNVSDYSGINPFASCEIPFLHLDGRMTKQEIALNVSGRVSVHNSPGATSKNSKTGAAKPTAAVLRCKVQWLQSLSQAELEGALLNHSFKRARRRQAKLAGELHNDGLGIGISGQNFTRFVVCSTLLWTQIDCVLGILLWQNPSTNVAFLMGWFFVCAIGFTSIVSPPTIFAILAGGFLAGSHWVNVSGSALDGADGESADTSVYVPYSHRPMSVAKRLQNITSVQNFMKVFADFVDAVYFLLDVQLRRNSTRLYLRSAIYFAIPAAYLILAYIPVWIFALFAGWVVLLAGNPYVRAVLGIVGFRLHRYHANFFGNKYETSRVQVDDSTKTSKIVVMEYDRWWVGLGWKNVSFVPKPLQDAFPPPGFVWHGLWQVESVDGEEYEYSTGLPADNKFHTGIKPSDFVRRRRWVRRIKVSQNSDNGRRERIESVTDPSRLQKLEKEGKVVQIEVFENERWWVGAGFVKRYWPHEQMHSFTDSNGVGRGKDFFDEKEALLFSGDAEGPWVDQWQIDGGWEYARDFHKKFTIKAHAGTFDYVRRRRWVRRLRIKD